MKKQHGFSLVELMVAMVLGLIITAAATQLFIANQQSFVLQQTLARVQEDGQLFVRFLVGDLRRAGLEGDTVVSTRTMGIQFSNPAGGTAYPVTQEGATYDRLTLGYMEHRIARALFLLRKWKSSIPIPLPMKVSCVARATLTQQPMVSICCPVLKRLK